MEHYKNLLYMAKGATRLEGVCPTGAGNVQYGLLEFCFVFERASRLRTDTGRSSIRTGVNVRESILVLLLDDVVLGDV